MRPTLVLLALVLAGCSGAAFYPERALNPQGGENAPGSAPHPFRGLASRAYVETTRGTFVIELAVEMAPATVTDFTARAHAGEYDGTRFHRIVKDYLLQGGDPHSRDEDRSAWGAGGFDAPKPDEFHPELRHDVAGTVSMATGRPDSVGAQFFVTLRPARELDDRFTVIGYVVAGMDVVRAIAASPTIDDAPDGSPVDPVVIRRVSVVAPDGPAATPARGIDAFAPFPTRMVPSGATAYAAVVVRNAGDMRESVWVDASAPPSWRVTFNPSSPLALPARSARVVLAVVEIPDGAADGTVSVTARSADGAASSVATLEMKPMAALAWAEEGKPASANYATLLLDGRLVDTNVASIAEDPRLVPMSSFYRPRQTHQPFDFTPGVDVVPGFTWIALRTPVGGTQAAWIPAAMGYADGDRGENPLAGRDVVFEVELLAAG